MVEAAKVVKVVKLVKVVITTLPLFLRRISIKNRLRMTMNAMIIMPSSVFGDRLAGGSGI